MSPSWRVLRLGMSLFFLGRKLPLVGGALRWLVLGLVKSLLR